MNASLLQKPTPDAAHQDEALRTLYAEHADAVFGYVLSLVSYDHDRAADVVQETMLRAWRTTHRLDAESSLRPWLLTVARRIVIDGHRRRTARPPETDGTALERMAGADEIEAMLTRVVVMDAIASLSEQHRRVLHEVYYRRSNVPQASAALGIPPGTVRSRRHYALQALRLALTERGVHGRG